MNNFEIEFKSLFTEFYSDVIRSKAVGSLREPESWYGEFVKPIMKRATERSAAYDLECAEDLVIEPYQEKSVLFNVIFDVLVYDFDYKTVLGIIAARSSLAKKKGLIIKDNYKIVREKEILIVPFYNFTDTAVTIKAGEKIAQILFTDQLCTAKPEMNFSKMHTKFGNSLQWCNLVQEKLNLGNSVETDRFYFMTEKSVDLVPGKVTPVMTGLKCELQDNQVLFIENCLTQYPTVRLANGIGIIDADYYNNVDNEGNLGVLLLNLGYRTITIPAGTSIGCGFIGEYCVTEDDEHGGERTGGFGSTDK